MGLLPLGWLEGLRAKLWVAPGAAVVLALATAKGVVHVDRRVLTDRYPLLFGGAPDGAREVLSTIASSMITFTGLVFSITILVLQLASSQFSPRVLRTFLEDRVTHVAMGTFVGTFVFALSLLTEVRTDYDDHEMFVPRLSVTAAILLVLISVGVFVRYIDHMAHAVRAITIIKRIAAEGRRELEAMYPERGADADLDEPAAPEGPTDLVVHAERAGVLSAVDQAALLRAACDADGVIALVPMPGDFVPRDAPLARFWGDPSRLDEAVVRRAIGVTDERTVHEDPAFALRQLVDIAERALSPGVNDPGTAVQVLDEIHDLLRDLSQRRFPSPNRLDASGTLRLVLPRPRFEALVHLGVDEIRQYGASSVQVARRLRGLLEDCAATADGVRGRCFEEQLRLLDESTARSIDVPADRVIAREPSAQGHGDR